MLSCGFLESRREDAKVADEYANGKSGGLRSQALG